MNFIMVCFSVAAFIILLAILIVTFIEYKAHRLDKNKIPVDLNGKPCTMRKQGGMCTIRGEKGPLILK